MEHGVGTKSDVLFRNAKQGGATCLGPLLEAYANYLKLLAQTQLDAKLQRRVSASDLVQDTMLEACRDFRGFQGATEAEFAGWLHRILVNNLARVVERHLLAEKRDVRREVYLADIGAALDRSTARLECVLADPGASPTSEAQQHEHLLALADALADLTQDHREVIVLRHLEGLSFKEVAERMGRSAGAVRMLWLRAIEQLRARLRARDVL
jgi:RNA polymerase sigma-70 factor (ECF subfamily)